MANSSVILHFHHRQTVLRGGVCFGLLWSTFHCALADETHRPKVRHSANPQKRKKMVPLSGIPQGKLHYKLEFIDNSVAIGSIPGDVAHEARFKITVTRDMVQPSGKSLGKASGAVPVAGLRVPTPKIIAGGRGPFVQNTARVWMTAAVTNKNGQAFGKLLSGSREESVELSISPSGATSDSKTETDSIAQIYNDLLTNDAESDHSWNFNPQFLFGVPRPVSYRMALRRSGKLIPIRHHHVALESENITAEEWMPTAGPDEDRDGVPDGAYVLRRYESKDPGFNAPLQTTGKTSEGGGIARSALAAYSPKLTSSSTGTYTWKLTIVENPTFVIDGIEFNAYDMDAFESDGDSGD